MHTYTLILSVFIFFATAYIAIKIQPKITINKILISIFSAAILSITVFFIIKFLNNLPYDSAIKHSFFILIPFFVYIIYQFSLLENNNLFLNIFHGYKIGIDTEDNKLYLKFIGLSFFSYGFLYHESNNIFMYIMFIIFPVILMLETLSTLVLLLILIFTLSLNFYLIFTTIISLGIIKLFDLLITNLNTKYYKKLAIHQANNIKYNFLFNTTHDFISKFKIKTDDFSVLYYYDPIENITYSIKLNLIDELYNIINFNNFRTFLMFPKLNKSINLSFNDINFYYVKSEQYLKPIDFNQIKMQQELLDIEYLIKKEIKISELFKY